MMVVSFLFIAVISVRPASAGSESDKRSRLSEKVRLGIARLGVGRASVVEVRLRDKSKVTGYITEADGKGFVVTNEGANSSVPVAYSDVVKVKGNNLSTGAKIGIGVAIGVGIALIILAIYLNCCTG